MSARTTYYVTVIDRVERRYPVQAITADDARAMAEEDGEEVISVEHWTAVEEDS